METPPLCFHELQRYVTLSVPLLHHAVDMGGEKVGKLAEYVRQVSQEAQAVHESLHPHGFELSGGF